MLKLTAPDMLKIGELYRNGGVLDGHQIVPAAWIQQSTSAAPASADYGYMWWIANLAGHSTYLASGSYGNLVLVIPDLAAVLVVSGRYDPAANITGDDLVPFLTEVVLPRLTP